MRIKITLLFLVLASLACGTTVPRRTLDLYPTPTALVTQTPYVIIQTALVTSIPATQPPANVHNTPEPIYLAASPHLVQITGNVAVRDAQGIVRGWLLAGTVVQAACNGDRCTLAAGEFAGDTLWRGCTSDNPRERLCLTK